LIGNHEQRKSGLAEFLASFGGSWQKADLGGVAEVRNVFDEGIVSIQKNGGFSHDGGRPPVFQRG
jgi:hypothetical protein